MLAEHLNRSIILDELRRVRLAGEQELEQARTAGAPLDDTVQAVVDELRQAEQRETKTSSGQRAFQPTAPIRRGREPAAIDDFAFVSHDPIISLLQSALDQDAYRRSEEIEESPPQDDARRAAGDDIMVTDRRLRNAPEPMRDADGRRIFEKFSITDVNWVRAKLAEGLRCLRGKHAFKDRPAEPVELRARSRLILVGDWGSGLPRAQKVGQQIRRVLEQGLRENLMQQVIHLGDVYYSGWAHEYQRRFLPYWPVRIDEAELIGSWALNSNHDMYSGGYGFFDLLLADDRFARQKHSSLFALRHPNWNILGLDTAWEEGRLHEPQLPWISAHLDDGDRKMLLLSHHQLFSAYEAGNADLLSQFDPLLAERHIKAWFWGHEHRCLLYDVFNHVEFGRCIGHGGIPTYMWHGTEDPYPKPVIYEDRRFYTRGLERWAVFGFAVLDFDGPKINVRYIDENGQVPYQEVIV